MSARNGHVRDDIPALQQKLREARLRTRLARAEAEAQLLESFGVEPGIGYPTSWFDPFDQFSRHGWGVAGAVGFANNAGSRGARKDGGNQPFFWSEIDLERSRGLARWLATKNMLAVGALNALRNFTVKTGYKWEAVPASGWEKDPVAMQLAKQVQRAIDHFSDLNRMPQRERSAFLRSRRDGEVFSRFFGQDDGTTLFRFILPEQVRQPLGSPPNWSYGIETDPQDVETPLQYALNYSGDDEDFCFVPASEIAHLKLNVDDEVKRGLSDFYCTAQAFDETEKLIRNMRITGGIQSAIAWYEKFVSASQDALGVLAGKRKDLNRPQIQHPVTGRPLDYEHFEPGQVRLIGGNREMLPAPLAQNTTQHIAIAQASMRALGVRWNLPEFLISGDASNNNFASILIAGSPFVNSIECEQDDYRWYFLRWRWIAVTNAARAHQFVVDGRVFGIEEIMRLVDIHGTPPQVAISDKQGEASIDHQDLAAGVTSVQALRAKRGLDNDKIRQDRKEEPPSSGGGGGVAGMDGPGGPGGSGGQQGGAGGPIRVRRGGKVFMQKRSVRESKDASGHEHKGKGEGGGQFTSGGGGGGEKGKDEKATETTPDFTKAKATRGAMMQAVRDGAGKDAKIILRNGKPAPDHIKPSMVPPDWSDVRISLDPDAELLVQAVDNKGRPKSVYSDAHDLRTAAVKFARVDEMIRQGPAIDKEIQAARANPKTREQAECAWLMSAQATRPGSKADTGAKVKAYGATTLEGRHVIIDADDTVRLHFVGKEGVLHDHEIRDPKLAEMLKARKEKAGDTGKLFNTSENAVNTFIGKLDGGHFSAKDFRTRRANLIAAKAMARFEGVPKDDKQYKARVKAVAYQVSTVLGNKPAQCLESYINPAIFSIWRVPE